LNSNALVDLDPAKTYLKIPLADDSMDELVKDFINEVSDLIERYCNRRFRSDTVVEIHDGGRTNQLLLKQWPVSAVVSLHEDANRVFGADSLIDASQYALRDDDTGEDYYLQRYDSIFSQGVGTIRVEYTFGYVAFTDVPGALQLATKRTIGYYWKQQQNEDFVLSNKSKGDENITLIDGIPKAATQILDPFVRMELAGPTNPIRNL
jgi:hypothetical protein